MDRRLESAEQGEGHKRVLLVAVDDTDAASKAFDFAVTEVYKDGDELHLAHVIPRLAFAAQWGVPPVGYCPNPLDEAFDNVIKQAEGFIIERFVKKLPPDFAPAPVVHIIKSEVDTDTVGHVLVRKAEELQALCIVMATHNKGRLKEFFLGSVTQYVMHHSRQPVVVIPDKP